LIGSGTAWNQLRAQFLTVQDYNIVRGLRKVHQGEFSYKHKSPDFDLSNID